MCILKPIAFSIIDPEGATFELCKAEEIYNQQVS